MEKYQKLEYGEDKMGLQTHLSEVLNELNFHYGTDWWLSSGEKAFMEFTSNLTKDDISFILKKLRQTKQFNPVMRGRRIYLEAMPEYGGKRRR